MQDFTQKFFFPSTENVNKSYKIITLCFLSADLNKRLAKRGVEVDNLTKDWKDGEALCALVDYNVRGIYDLYLGIVEKHIRV